jgi:hypothetical protein
VAGLVLLAFAVALFGSHVLHGDFAYDDWALASRVKYQGYWSTVDFYLHIDHRPLVALYLPLIQLLTGESARASLAWIALTRVLMCVSLYAFVRTAGLERFAAGAIALLLLLFPFADASWLYVVGSPGMLAVSLYLLGATVALRGLDAGGPRGIRLHAMAVMLYVASVMLYELALIEICVTGALYISRAPHRIAFKRWAADIGATVVTVLLVTSRAVPLLPGQDVHAVSTVAQQVAHAKEILREGGNILAAALQPFGAVHSRPVLIVAALLTARGLATMIRLPPGHRVRVELRRWLMTVGAALVGLVCAWALLIPTDIYYSPGQVGVGNRINTMAGVCICVLAFSLAMVLVTLVGALVRALAGRFSHAARAPAAVAALVLAGFLAVGYARRIDTDKSTWAVATRLRRAELSVMHRAVPHPTSGTVIALFDVPAFSAPGVPIFAAPWDLDGAVSLTLRTSSLSAYPVLIGGPPVCSAIGVTPAGTGYTPQQEDGRYGSVLFVDGRSGAVTRLADQAQCRAALLRLPIGPTLLGGRPASTLGG